MELHNADRDAFPRLQIFWAVDPNDVPITLRENVEETVKDDTIGENKCAIIR